jgi:hypothetical protein
VTYTVDVDLAAEGDIAMRMLPFGSSGAITYLVVEDLRRVDVLVVTWIA